MVSKETTDAVHGCIFLTALATLFLISTTALVLSIITL